MIGPLQSAQKLVGMAAVQLAAKLGSFVDGPLVFTGGAATEQMHQLVCASIAFTTKLIAVVSNNDPSWATAAEMEGKLVAHLEAGGPANSADFQQAIEDLILAAMRYADLFDLNTSFHDLTYQLLRAAVVVTLRLTMLWVTILCSDEQPMASVGAAALAMEEVLLAHLDNAFLLPEILS